MTSNDIKTHFSFLQELVLFVLSGGLTEQSHLVAALATAGASMSTRADLIPSAQTFIQTLTVDLAMALGNNLERSSYSTWFL